LNVDVGLSFQSDIILNDVFTTCHFWFKYDDDNLGTYI